MDKNGASTRDEPILTWLMSGTHDMPTIEAIFAELCQRLQAAGVPVARTSLHFRTHHPQWLGSRMIWRTGMALPDTQTVDYDVEGTAAFKKSPFRAVIEGARQVRQRLVDSNEEIRGHRLYDDLRAEGLTDYLAMPLNHTLGKRHLVTFSTSAPHGFSDDDIAFLSGILPALALVSEIRIKNQLARTLLETYVGPHASDQILEGATTRGSGVTVDAAILICDLRGFTALSNDRPRDEVINLLNGFFDAMAGPIERHGGEILKFMGDGLLAIFPASTPTAYADLLRAIREALAGIAEMNEQHARAGRDTLGFGIGVHVGDVMYGNIGSRSRLDFTVIGPAVNIASRLEALTKTVKRPVLFSQDFVTRAGCKDQLENLGAFALRGLGDPVTVFGFPVDAVNPAAASGVPASS